MMVSPYIRWLLLDGFKSTGYDTQWIKLLMENFLKTNLLSIMVAVGLLTACGTTPEFWENMQYAACIIDKTKTPEICQQYKR